MSDVEEEEEEPVEDQRVIPVCAVFFFSHLAARNR